MKLFIFSDVHSDLAALRKLMEVDADYYFAAGDLVNWGKGLDAAGPILAAKADRTYVFPGNHESEDDIAKFCANFGLQNFHHRSIELAGYHLAGMGYSNPTPFDTPGEYSETELEQRLATFSSLQPLILICHCPPKNTALDRVKEGVHAGSSAVLEFIETHQPEYFFCGHIHEAAGVTMQIGKTNCLNVGKRGYLLEI